MVFSVEEMGFPVHYPNPELLSALTADSPMETPEKVKAVLGELKFPPAPADRPYLYGCMVLSFDGKMGFPDNPEGTLISKENRRDPIGGKTDFWIMNVCRAYADGVILGTGTLKARPRQSRKTKAISLRPPPWTSSCPLTGGMCLWSILH